MAISCRVIGPPSFPEVNVTSSNQNPASTARHCAPAIASHTVAQAVLKTQPMTIPWRYGRQLVMVEQPQLLTGCITRPKGTYGSRVRSIAHQAAESQRHSNLGILVLSLT